MVLILVGSLFVITTFSYVVKKSIDRMAAEYKIITNQEIIYNK